jgi:hypothetical protein
MTRVNMGRTQGCLVKIKGTIVRIGQVFGGVDEFAIANLFNRYGSTLLIHWLGTVLQLT